MKLLSKSEAQRAKQQQDAAIHKDLDEANTVYQGLVSKINDAKAEHRVLNERLAQDFETRSKEINKKISVLENEVAKLEKRKERALQPLTEREELIAKREAELTDAQQDLAKREYQLETGKSQLAQESKKLKSLSKKLDEKSRFHKQVEKRLLKKSDSLKDREQEQNNNFQLREDELTKNERALQNDLEDYRLKMTALKLQSQNIARREKQLENEEKRIESKRSALKTAFDEARKKGLV